MLFFCLKGWYTINKGAIQSAIVSKQRAKERIDEYNKKEKQCPLRKPDLKIVITGTEYGYRRDDGVFVIPIGCLKD